MRCSPCGGRGWRQRAQPPAFVTLPFVPGTWHPAQGAAAIRRAVVTGTGQSEGRQSPSSAARRVFWLRWQGDTSCDCTFALPPRHRRMNSRLQPAAAPASLSLWAGGGGADGGWSHRAVGQRGVPSVSHSPATSSHPAGPASCHLPRAKHPRPRPTRSSWGWAALSSSPPSTELHRGFTGTSKPHAQGKCPCRPELSMEKRDRALVPAAFRSASGGCRRLAGVARPPSRAGRGSICFAAPRGFLNRSLLFNSLWDLEKPVVPDNLWTHQHRRSSGSPGARCHPPGSSWGGTCPTISARWEVGGWLGSPPHPELYSGVLLPAEGVLSPAMPNVGWAGGAFPGLGWLPAPGFALGPFAARARVLPLRGELGAHVGCSGVCSAVHPPHPPYTRMRRLRHSLFGVSSPSSGTRLLAKPPHGWGG